MGFRLAGERSGGGVTIADLEDLPSDELTALLDVFTSEAQGAVPPGEANSWLSDTGWATLPGFFDAIIGPASSTLAVRRAEEWEED